MVTNHLWNEIVRGGKWSYNMNCSTTGQSLCIKSVALCSQDCLTQLFLNDWGNKVFSVLFMALFKEGGL